jgi:hypothetical protein
MIQIGTKRRWLIYLVVDKIRLMDREQAAFPNRRAEKRVFLTSGIYLYIDRFISSHLPLIDQEPIMKTLASLLLISAALAGASAYAQEPSGELDYPPAISQIVSLSHAQVMAELEAAKAAGQLIFGDIDEPVTELATSSLTREQVRAETAAAREHGSVAFGGEGYPNTGA